MLDIFNDLFSPSEQPKSMQEKLQEQNRVTVPLSRAGQPGEPVAVEASPAAPADVFIFSVPECRVK